MTNDPPAAATHEPFTPDDVIYSSKDGTTYRADLLSAAARPVSGSMPNALPTLPVGLHVPKVSSDGQRSAHLEATTSESGLHLTVVISDYPTGTERGRYSFVAGFPQGSTMLEWSPTSEWLYVASDDEHLHVLDSDEPRRTVRMINVPNARDAVVVAEED